MKKISINRRRFIKMTSFTGGGLMLGFLIPSENALASLAPDPDCEFFQPNAYLRIDKKGNMRIFPEKKDK